MISNTLNLVEGNCVVCRLLKKSRGFGPFIDAARWRHSESSASNRQQNSKSYRSRYGSQNMKRNISVNNMPPPQTTNVRLSMMKSTGKYITSIALQKYTHFF